MNAQLYDVIIVGGGHAGLSAALTLYRQLHTVLILDNRQPRDTWAKPTHIVMGWEGRQAQELREACESGLAATGLVTIKQLQAQKVERIADGFEITDEGGQTWKGRKLLLAAGKRNVFPSIPGYAENYPERIFHCMFTFGYEHRGASHAGLLAEGALSNPKHTAMVAGDTLKFAKRITVYTNGNQQLMKTLQHEIGGTTVAVDSRRILGIHGLKDGLQLKLEGGSDWGEMKFLVHQPATKIDLPLVKQLGLRLDERGDIMNTPPFFQTEAPGVFAAGDCATPFKIIPMAMFMGANAGAGLSRSLAADRARQTEPTPPETFQQATTVYVA